MIANVLLLYFREMSQPLLEFKLYDKWVQALGQPPVHLASSTLGPWPLQAEPCAPQMARINCLP